MNLLEEEIPFLEPAIIFRFQPFVFGGGIDSE